MKNRDVTYLELYKGDVLLLVPKVRESGFAGIKNEILWSLREFDFKVFAYLDVDCIISRSINERAVVGLPFYDIEMNMYNTQTYPENIKSWLKDGWDYAVMRQAYRYFDQLTKNFPTQIPTAFAVSCRWHSNSHQALQIFPLDDQYLGLKNADELCILFSSFNKYSEEYIEDLLVKIGKCKRLQKNYQSWKPENKNYQPVLTEHLIKRHNVFFLLRGGEVYCGLDWISPDILLKTNWNLFAKEMIHPKGCKDCNPGYKMKICLPDNGLGIFNHKLLKDYATNFGNDCYSEATQFINIIHTQWKRIQEENPFMQKIVFEMKYDATSGGKKTYIAVTYLNFNWDGPTREIMYTRDADYILQKKEEIAKAL